MSVMYQLDLNQKGRQYPHYWEMCVGSCHASTILREDVRQQIRKAHKEIGFQYLRFHGLFDDDMSVVINPMIPIGAPQISFFNIDNIFDFLLDTGMKPFIELGFMPEAFASGRDTCFHYNGNICMPKDDQQWSDFIAQFTQHLIDRYGLDEVKTWFFEVWNEPNLRFFFNGTQEDYFHLYELSARAVKSVNADLKVGGPATSNNMWIPELIDFCKKNAVPLDFISTHHYPSDDPLSMQGMNGPGVKGQGYDMSPEAREKVQSMPKEEIEEMMKSFFNRENKNPRDILAQLTRKAKDEAGDLPLYYTEWNGSVEYDTCYMAATVTQTLAYNEGMVEGYSYWTVSDIFEEMGLHGLPFNNEFGLQNVYGIAKPVYRVFEELHKAGSKRLDVSGTPHATAEVMALADDDTVTLFAYNHDIVRRQIQAEEMEITIEGAFKHIEKAVIDDEHCNPLKTWEAQGKPVYPTKEQLAEMDKESQLVFETIAENGTNADIKFTAQPESVTIIRIRR